MSRRLLFLGLIGLMLFVLAIAGQDRSRLAAQLTSAVFTRPPDALNDPESSRSEAKLRPSRSPASVARTLEIEPVLPGGE